MTTLQPALTPTPLSRDDLDDLHDLLAATRRGLVAGGYHNWRYATPRAQLLGQLAWRAGETWGAAGASLGVRDAQGRLIACCALRLEPTAGALRLLDLSGLGDTPVAVARSLVLSPEARDLGLGAPLIRAVAALARSAGRAPLATADAEDQAGWRLALSGGGLMLARGPAEHNPRSQELLIGLDAPEAMGLHLVGPRISVPAGSPVARWGHLLDRGLVARLDAGRLTFSAACPAGAELARVQVA